MRPVERGQWPTDSDSNRIHFSKYNNARSKLIESLGEYCSFCEQRLGASLAVEHVLPKSLYPDLELSWDNFLLACTNCNSTKGKKNPGLNNIYWPHIDNTFLAYEYKEGGIIEVSKFLNNSEKIKAKATMELTGLQKMPGNNTSASDRRYQNRRQCYELAKRSYNNLQKINMKEMRKQIVMTAQSRGFFSVWITVFRNDKDMKKRLIHAFTGTCFVCFDNETFEPKKRNPDGL